MSARAQTVAKAPLALATTADKWLESVRGQAPVVDRVLSEYGHRTIREYLREAFPVTHTCFQPRNDLVTVVGDYAEKLLGGQVAANLRSSLEKLPLALTANHHGVDYFAQSVQGNLILSLMGAARGNPQSSALVFACGGVPLDNFTYPMGMLIYSGRPASWETLPTRVPIFSNRYRREMVSSVGPVDAAMVERAQQRCNAMVDKGDICESLSGTLHSILEEYFVPDVLELDDYSRQSVVLNHRLWSRLFAASARQPTLVVLELEKIARELLAQDLGNANSLAWCVHFDAQLRRQVLNALDGAHACWNSELLASRLQTPGSRSDSRNAAGSGTFLYWGVTERGRRVPLYPDERGGSPCLRGIDDNGNAIEIPLSPDAIKQNISHGRLLPSLFNCFLTVSFARGVNCAGAYYQAEYLPAMQQGLVAALRTAAGYERAAQCVASVPTDSYLAGMQTVMQRHGEGALIPAGPAEIIAAGGLTEADLETILSMSVRDAHVASLMETVADLAPQDAKSAAWRERISQDCHTLLADSVVIK